VTTANAIGKAWWKVPPKAQKEMEASLGFIWGVTEPGCPGPPASPCASTCVTTGGKGGRKDTRAETARGIIGEEDWEGGGGRVNCELLSRLKFKRKRQKDQRCLTNPASGTVPPALLKDQVQKKAFRTQSGTTLHRGHSCGERGRAKKLFDAWKNIQTKKLQGETAQDRVVFGTGLMLGENPLREKTPKSLMRQGKGGIEP